MEFLGTFPPEKLNIVIEFLEKENLAYTTSREITSLGHMNVPTGNVVLLAEPMDAFQQLRYVEVAKRTLN
jgi:hypothetical protein